MVLWDEEVTSKLNTRETSLQQKADEVLICAAVLSLSLELDIGYTDQEYEKILGDMSKANVYLLATAKVNAAGSLLLLEQRIGMLVKRIEFSQVQASSNLICTGMLEDNGIQDGLGLGMSI